MNKQPQITAQTRQKFIDAFWAALEEKNIGQITVGELAKAAGYNRSTFYEYFTDIPDLLAQEEARLLSSIKKEMENLKPGNIENMAASNQYIFQNLFYMENQELYYLLGPHGDPTFFETLKGELLPALQAAIQMPPDYPNLDYIIAFLYGAVISFLGYWHSQGKSLPETEVFRLGHMLVTHGILGTMQETAAQAP